MPLSKIKKSMKLTLRLVTNKPVKIDLDFRKYMDYTVSKLKAVEHSEQIVEFDIKPSLDSDPEKVVKAIKEVIKKEYPNITSIEGLKELEKLIE